MANEARILNINDADISFRSVDGQRLVYEAANEYFSSHTEAMMMAYSLFVEEETEEFKERYYLPGGGRMPRRGRSAQAPATAVTGKWDVAYPLEDFGRQYGASDVDLAYMTLQQVERQVNGIRIQDVNTMRHEILYRLMNNTQTSFEDKERGDLLVEPAANGDTVVYPPVEGSESGATDNHYLASGYAATAISNTNNPFPVIRRELEEHFGKPPGYGNVMAFVHEDEMDEIESLGDFTPVDENGIIDGDDVSRALNMEGPMVGTLRGRANGVWVVEWNWITTGYIGALTLDADGPLKVRRDPGYTGLGRGLQLVSESDKYPLQFNHYRHRFGVGCGNRLNWVAMQLTTGGTYAPPSLYS